MFDISSLVATICEPRPRDLTFEPTDVQLSDPVIQREKADDEPPATLSVDTRTRVPTTSFEPQFSVNCRVVAIDSTSVVLGYVREGLVGAIRASVITKPEGTTRHQLKHFGPYLSVITNYNKDAVYERVAELVYGEAKGPAPDLRKTLDRLRNLLERQLQLQAAESLDSTLILIDGSLRSGAVADPQSAMRKFVDSACQNNNALVALSKSTSLTLRENQLSILSLIDGVPGACYVGDLRSYLTQQQGRYMGCVYVGRLIPNGETFRFDIPEQTLLPHTSIFAMVSGLSGEHGYPEELKLAHMTSFFSAIEVIELQAAAINLHGLTMKENIRRKLFPM
ncbi:MAG: DNA double-strand break repair nuclease NurA [Halobacteriota archaeon]